MIKVSGLYLLKRRIPVYLKISGVGIVFIFLLLISSFRRDDPAADSMINVRFRVYIHGEPLQLNKKYKNPFGEVFEISMFRFYAGKIGPSHADGARQSFSEPVYHLIDFSDSSSTGFNIRVPAGPLRELQFQLGIDSADQNQGAQKGALDPIKGMFWTWNSGYLSFKIEGTAASSGQPAHMIAYHIGGYRSPFSTVWKMKLSPDTVLQSSMNNRTHVEIPVELDYFFDGPFPLHIKEIPDCTTPGELARKISKNFASAFTGLMITGNP